MENYKYNCAGLQASAIKFVIFMNNKVLFSVIKCAGPLVRIESNRIEFESNTNIHPIYTIRKKETI